MDDFHEIARVDDLPPGRAKSIVVGERKIALFHTASGFFASDDSCPHRGGPLGQGDLIDDEIICPWHLWGFDIRSGVCTGNREIRVVIHDVRLEGDRILVKLNPVVEQSDAL
jgi:Ferredoxin subunits of nitrite reductase and ring-hydroxylating dioxygenases